MAISLQDMILGGGHKRQYTPEEQAAFSAKYPSLVWRDGVPYTPSAGPEDTGYDGPNSQYSGQTGREDQAGGLVEADLNDPNFLAQLGRFAGATSAAQYGASFLPGGGPFGESGFTGGGTGAVGGYSSSVAPTSAMGSPTAGVSFAPGATGSAMASPTAGVSFAPGAAGAGSATGVGAAAPALAAPNVGAALPNAVSGTSLATPPAAGGWGAWLGRVQQLLPMGADIFRGINARSALKDAQKTEQAATEKALKSQQAALQTAGDVYKQQRADTQNLAGQSFQTLGGLMGMNISPIGAPTGAVPSTASPTGMPTGLVPASQTRPLQVNDPWVGGTPSDLVPYRGAPTLQQIAALGRKQQSASSYGKARA